MRSGRKVVEKKERFHEDLLQKRIIYLFGEITETEANRIGKAVIWLNAKSETEPITLFVTSQGGDVGAGLDIYDILKLSQAPVTGVVYRLADSMAAVVLQACKTRKILKHAEMTLHAISVGRNINDLQENLEKALEVPKRQQEQIYNIFAAVMKSAVEQVRELLKSKPRLAAEDLRKLGLVDEVVE